MRKDNLLPINTGVIVTNFGYGTIVGFIKDGNSWRYRVSFDDMQYVRGIWFAGESVRRANWIERLLYG